MESNLWIQKLSQENATEKSIENATGVVTELFEQYAAPLCSYLHFLIGDLETAYDLTQETFLRIMRTQHQLAAVENQRAWLYRIATNLAHNHRRHQDRFAWIPWHKVEYTQTSPDEGIERQFAIRQIVEKCLAHLPLIYRAPLLLHVDHGFSIREVASMLEIGEGAVKTRLWRGRELFRLAYEKEMEEKETEEQKDEQEERAQNAKATT